MKDVLMFFCFFCLFTGNLVHNKISSERHNEVMSTVDSIKTKVDSIYNQTEYIKKSLDIIQIK